MLPALDRIQYPPGLTPWGMGSSTTDPTQWTGVYVVTILVAGATPETVSKALPPGFRADASLARRGEYPVLLLFGSILGAANRMHPYLGLNYTEVFSAIPGVHIDSPDANDGFDGPYLYPYRGYLNHLAPCILGWLASYPKVWSQITHERLSPEENHDSFTVRPLLGGDPLFTADFETELSYKKLEAFRPQVDKIITLVSPNIIHRNLFGSGYVRSVLDLAFFESAVAWNMRNADIKVYKEGLFPGLTGTLPRWKGLEEEEYGAARFVLAWRLIPQQSKEFEPATWPPPLWQRASAAST